ncbi:hypothetical protein ABPG75_001342 [Micractinium tetrahymenae]
MTSSSAAGLPDYDAGWSAGFLRLADLSLVVEGQELPVHSQVVARESQVITTLLEAQQADELSVEQQTDTGEARETSICAEGSHSSAATSASSSRNGLCQLAAPFADYSLPEVQLFLLAVYGQRTEIELLQQRPWEDLCGALRLADQLDAPRVMQLLESSSVAKLGDDCTQMKQWWPALEAADGLQQQAPRLYDRVLALSSSALLDSMRAGAAAPLLVQQLLTDDRHLKLSSATLAKLLGTFAAGVRAATGGVTGCNWGPIQHSLAPEWEHRGSYTWNWVPGFGCDDPRARLAVNSPSFTVGGVDWHLRTYLNGTKHYKGHPSLFLDSAHLRTDGAGLAVTFSIAVKESTCGPDAGLFSGASTWGWGDFLSRAELEDPKSGFLVDGALTIPITVELTFRRLDMPAKRQ